MVIYVCLEHNRLSRLVFDYACLQLSGLGILIAGAIVLADVNEFNHFIEGRVLAPPIVLIVTGLIIFLIASLGCFGAIKESPTLLLTVRRSPTTPLPPSIISFSRLSMRFSWPSSSLWSWPWALRRVCSRRIWREC